MVRTNLTVAEQERAEPRQQQRKDDNQGRTKKGAPNRGEAADDDNEQDLERPVEVEAGRLHGAKTGEGKQHTATPMMKEEIARARIFPV